MKNKLTLLFFGSLITLSITSPPEFLNILGFNFSEITIILTVIFYLIFFLANKKIKFLFIYLRNSYWFFIFLILFSTFLIYGFNSLTIRFIFYTFFGFLSYVFLRQFSLRETQYLFLPFLLVTLLNLFTVIFELSFLNNTTGWISYFYENPSFLNRGRLAGYQGGGPNVAGSIFTFLTFIFLYFYSVFNNKIYLFISLLNLFLIFVTFSRGSWLALFISLIIYLYVNKYQFKTIFFSILSLSMVLSFFLLIGNTQILLKESDRGYLTKIALDNISVFKGYGGGNYVEEIYGNYFLSINPDILEQNLNITLDKVELGITPEEFRNSGVDFFIGTSGGGFELLQQSNIVSECSDDRTTCQHVRVEHDTILKFFSAIFKTESLVLENYLIETGCKEDTKNLYSRGEFYCIVEKLIQDKNLNNNSELLETDFFVECEASKEYTCENRKLAIGELSVIVENLSLKKVNDKNKIPIENYQLYCDECKFRSVSGFIKIEFDKREGIIPRSTFKFFTSPDGDNWDQVGFTRTKGEIITFVPNNSYIELGGHSDGQSFGNTFLDANVLSIEISTLEKTKKIIFEKQKQNEDFFVFKPNTLEDYKANITYENNGIKLFRPNKYWVAINNEFDFTNDFQIILNLTLPEIPWETHTLISNSSIFNDQIQSWKVDIDDGRIFFNWTNEEGVYTANNVIGDKSLRSGILIQENGKLSNQRSPIVDPSFLSQLTTAHNGYLTFAVEYGLFISILFFLVVFFFIFKLINELTKENIFLFLCLTAFLFQNLTNDMIYSSDAFILFNLVYALIIYSINPLETKNS